MPDEATEREQMSRKDREREQHRREILKAAERVFARKGYQGATVEEIAQEAEFAVGTIYKFFKGKDELYSQAAEGLFQEFMGQFETQVRSLEDPEEAIGALIELRLTYSEEHRRFLRVFFDTSHGSGVDLIRVIPSHVARIYDGYLAAIRELFERGISQRTFDEADPLYLTLCLEGIINAFVAYWSRNEPVEPLAVRIAKMKHEFLGRIKLRLDGGPP